MNNWISVNDRLPDEWVEVLTYQPLTSEPTGIVRVCVYIGNINGEDRWRVSENHELTEIPVTNWMPLPEPPEEVQEDG